jgi:CO/xanthine dehydrogenase Mo-binding subunit
MQANGIMEPVISKAARMLGLDQVDVRRINAPAGKAPFGAPLANGKQNYVTSAFVKEALDKGRELFKWDEKKALYSGKRQGTKARGIGVAVSPFAAGSIGFDGLFIIKPDGRVTFQTGIGNHGTAWRQTCWTCPGSSATWSSGTRRRTCRGPASRPAVRPRMR